MWVFLNRSKTCFLFLFFIVFILNPIAVYQGAKAGVELWLNIIIPTLLPFFIVAELLNKNNVFLQLSKIFEFILRPLFNVPGVATLPIIMGFTSGFPVGSVVVANLRDQRLITQEEGERLLAFTNNVSPLFLLSTVGIALLSNPAFGFFLLIGQYSASLLIGVVLGIAARREKIMIKNNFKIINSYHYLPFGKVLQEAIESAFSKIFLVGGFIIFFAVLISLVEKIFLPASNFSTALLAGFLEISNGVKKIAELNLTPLLKLILMSFILSFGGLSVFAQILAIISKTDLTAKMYLKTRPFHGLISTFITALLYYNLTIPVNSINLDVTFNFPSLIKHSLLLAFTIYLIFYLFALITKKTTF
ncbi:sporulation integral membrane protein YlbJ [Carboxydothermus pertinax]|uniref:Sporulation integral membrane protein YlbJ n=1 Tax=Carboxydothermus pertinax TaxID=870242 RepID=A0A1L8CXR9_9THEO|nr:sporulation integral membrane protein YlbJ [Carboxydothermus pertinax]GAV23700.1 sporulation integral membrane protein YlbJ [Carboxydothermus pertinax]